MSLKETWKDCMSLWGFIYRKKMAGDKRSVYKLKIEWTDKREQAGETHSMCFFCLYDAKRKTGCATCPGVKVDPDFDCYNPLYNFNDNPVAFYNKLRSLNRKREAKLELRRQMYRVKKRVS